jgi:hypothetical protein
MGSAKIAGKIYYRARLKSHSFVLTIASEQPQFIYGKKKDDGFRKQG